MKTIILILLTVLVLGCASQSDQLRARAERSFGRPYAQWTPHEHAIYGAALMAYNQSMNEPSYHTFQPVQLPPTINVEEPAVIYTQPYSNIPAAAPQVPYLPWQNY